MVVPDTTRGDPPWLTLPAPAPLPKPDKGGHARVNGIDLYHAIFAAGRGDPVLLLHGGMGSADDWGNQVPALSGRHTVIAMDSRGHGRSTRGDQPIGYRLMAADVVGLLDHLAIDRVAIAGWSDGGIIGLELAMSHPQRLTRLWAEGANSTPSGLKDPRGTATAEAAGRRAALDYARLSPTPERFQEFRREILAMWASQPDFKPGDLAGIATPTAIVAGEHDEFVKRENMVEMARLIPGARLIVLANASHFGLWQNPAAYNEALARFLAAA